MSIAAILAPQFQADALYIDFGTCKERALLRIFLATFRKRLKGEYVTPLSESERQPHTMPCDKFRTTELTGRYATMPSLVVCALRCTARNKQHFFHAGRYDKMLCREQRGE